jgi:hypothetical protein
MASAVAVSRSATPHVSVNAITWSAASSPISQVSNFASSICTMVGTTHCVRSGNSCASDTPNAEPTTPNPPQPHNTGKIKLEYI